MPASLDKVGEDRLLTERLAGFEAMQALDQDEPVAVFTNQDRRRLTLIQDALGDGRDFDGVERRPPLCRHIDARHSQRFRLQHHQNLSRSDVRSALIKPKFGNNPPIIDFGRTIGLSASQCLAHVQTSPNIDKLEGPLCGRSRPTRQEG